MLSLPRLSTVWLRMLIFNSNPEGHSMWPQFYWLAFRHCHVERRKCKRCCAVLRGVLGGMALSQTQMWIIYIEIILWVYKWYTVEPVSEERPLIRNLLSYPEVFFISGFDCCAWKGCGCVSDDSFANAIRNGQWQEACTYLFFHCNSIMIVTFVGIRINIGTWNLMYVQSVAK